MRVRYLPVSFLYPPGTIMFHQFMYFFIFTAKNVNPGIISNFITAGIFNINLTTLTITNIENTIMVTH